MCAEHLLGFSLDLHTRWDALRALFPLLWEVVAVLLLVVVAAFFAGSETALFSLTRMHRDKLTRENTNVSRRVLWLLKKPHRLFGTLILGNEAVNISITALVTGIISSLFLIRSHAYVGFFATLVTLPILVIFAELIPKTIALRIGPTWARWAALPLTLLMWILWVPRTVVSLIAAGVIFLFSRKKTKKGEQSASIREDEIKTLVDLGQAEGEIEQREKHLIHNVFDFSDRNVAQIMTSIEKVFALPVEMDMEEMKAQVIASGFSRVPLYRGRVDNVVGILLAKDLLGLLSEGGLPTKDALRQRMVAPLFVPKKATCDRLFREFKNRKVHIALVVDEYGQIAGIVTMDDLLQTLFGADESLEASSPTSGGAHHG